MNLTTISQKMAVSEELKERVDINANIASPYLKADDLPEIAPQESSSIESASLGVSTPNTPIKIISGIFESIKNFVGNYIANDPSAEEAGGASKPGAGSEPIDETPSSGKYGKIQSALTADEAGGAGNVSEEEAAQGADSAYMSIEEMIFQFEHCGMEKTTWNAMIAWMIENGLEEVVKALEENPENAPQILDYILDPNGYWDQIHAEAKEQANEANDKIKEILEKYGFSGEGVWFKDDPAGKTLNISLSEESVIEYDEMRVVNEGGQYKIYFYKGNQVVKETTVDALVEKGKISFAQANQWKQLADQHNGSVCFTRLKGYDYDSFRVYQDGRVIILSHGSDTWTTLDELVASGAISQEKADMLLNAAKESGEVKILNPGGFTYKQISISIDGTATFIGSDGDTLSINLLDDNLDASQAVISKEDMKKISELLISYADRKRNIWQKLNRELGLPDDWDPKKYFSFYDNFKRETLHWRTKMWTVSDDSGYMAVDARFFGAMEKINGLFNLLSVLFMLAQAKIDLKRIIAEIALDYQPEKAKFSLLESAGTMRANAMSNVRFQLFYLQKYVNSFNERIYQQKINQAHKDAYNEAREGGTGAGNYLSEIFSLGQSNALSNSTNLLFQGKKKEIDAEKKDFEQKMFKQYAQALGKDTNFNSGDDFGGQIDNLIGGISFEDLMLVVPADKESDYGDMWDLNRDNVFAVKQEITDIDNLRKLWYILQLAREKLKEIVAQTTIGKDVGSESEGLVMGALNDIQQLEQQIVSKIINQAHTVIGMNNLLVQDEIAIDRAQRKYVIDLVCGATVIFKDLFGSLANYFNELDLDSKIPNYDFGSTNLNLEKVIKQVGEAKTEMGERILDSDQSAAKTIDELEKRQWELIGELDEDSSRFIHEGNDEFWRLEEAKINELRERLTAAQNLERMIFMLARAKNRFKEIISKLLRKVSVGTEDMTGSDAIDSILENKMLAFELKKTSLQLQVNEHNNQVARARAVEQAGARIGGAMVGVAVAAVLTAVTFGAGAAAAPMVVMAVIGLFGSLSSLGAALGGIIYNIANPVDELNLKENDFYETVKVARKRFEQNAYDALDRLREEEKNQIDRVKPEGSVDIGSGQFGLNAETFMSVNSELKGIQILMKIIIMLEQAKNDLVNSVSAATAGVSGQDGGDHVKGAVRVADAARAAALSLKRDMVNDINAARNRSAMADREMEQSIATSVISGISALACGLGSIGNAGLSSLKAVQYGLSISSVINAVVNMAYAIDDYADADIASLQNSLREIIDEIYKAKHDSLTAKLELAEKEVLSAAKASLVSGIGGGKVAVNSAAFADLRDEIDKIYNVFLAMAKVNESRNGMLKRLASILGISAGREDGTITEAFYAAKDKSMENLSYLQQKASEFADRTNQIEELRTNMIASIAVAAVSLASFVMSTLPSFLKDFNITDKMPNAMDKIDEWMHKKFDSDKTTAKLFNAETQSVKSFFADMVGLGDGKISLGDLAGIVKNVLFSQEFNRYIMVKIAQSTAKDKGRAEKIQIKNKMPASAAAQSFVDYLDTKAAAEETASGKLEIDAAKEELILLIERELHQFLVSFIKDAKEGIGQVRLYKNPKIVGQTTQAPGAPLEQIPASKQRPSEAIPRHADRRGVETGTVVPNASPSKITFSDYVPASLRRSVEAKKEDKPENKDQFPVRSAEEEVKAEARKAEKEQEREKTASEIKDKDEAAKALEEKTAEIIAGLARQAVKWFADFSVPPSNPPSKEINGKREVPPDFYSRLRELFGGLKEKPASMSEFGRKAADLVNLFGGGQSAVQTAMITHIAGQLAELTGRPPQVLAKELAAFLILQSYSPAVSDANGKNLLSQAEKLFLDLKAQTEIARKQSERGDANLTLARQAIQRLAVVLPRAITGFDLKEVKKIIAAGKEEDLQGLLEKIAAASKELGLTSIAKTALKSAIENFKTISANKKTSENIAKLVRMTADPKTDPFALTEAFVNMGSQLKNKIISQLRTNIASFSADQKQTVIHRLEYLSLDTRIDRPTRQKIEVLIGQLEKANIAVLSSISATKNIASIPENWEQAFAALAAAVPAQAKEIKKKEEQRGVDVKLERSPAKFAGKNAVSAVSAEIAAKESRKRKEEEIVSPSKETEIVSAGPRMFEGYAGLSAHNKIVEKDRVRKDQSALA